MDQYNVLVFPAGSEIGLEVNNALKYAKDIKLFGATSCHDHSELAFANLIGGIPSINDAGCIDALNRCIAEHRIDFIYPALDSVQFFLSEHQDELDATVVSSPFETVRICRSKKRTYELFKGSWFIPQTFESVGDVDCYPVFVKPSVGQGSYDTHKVDTRFQLEATLEKGEDYAICEYLPGKEYTVDCFSDQGELVYLNLRERERTKAGISVRSSNVDADDSIWAIAEAINDKLDLRGAWFFQVKRNASNEYRLMEVAPRIAGTMAASRVQGINFPLLTIYSLLERSFSISNNDLRCVLEKAFINRYVLGYEFETVYIDYDDTLTIRDVVNVQAIAFLYQCVNQGKRIILLTRHQGDICKELARRHIDEGLFSKIIHLEEGARKSDYVDSQNAIFIDDSFSERDDVRKHCGVPVFDVDAIEALLDWRVA